MGKADFERLINARCPFVSATLHPGEACYLPTGWVVMERATPKVMLIYGVRNSFCMKAPHAAENFQHLIAFMKESNKTTDKYEQVLPIMKSD